MDKQFPRWELQLDRSSLTRRVVATAVAVASQLGLRIDEPVILHDTNNTLVHLRPAPVVARVATMTGTVREGPAWLRREVEVASFLTAAGAPVVPPSRQIDPGPHEQNGLALSFWELVEQIDNPPDPGAAGQTLRACHEALTEYPGDLPRYAALEEADRLVKLIAAEGLLTPADVALLERVYKRVRAAIDSLELPLQTLYGDATLGNVLTTRRGPLWGDFEDTFLGPTGWDLGCLASGARVYGSNREVVAAALAGYGATITEELLDLFIEARTFQVAAWLALLARQHNGHRGRLESRLRWLRERELIG